MCDYFSCCFHDYHYYCFIEMSRSHRPASQQKVNIGTVMCKCACGWADELATKWWMVNEKVQPTNTCATMLHIHRWWNWCLKMTFLYTYTQQQHCLCLCAVVANDSIVDIGCHLTNDGISFSYFIFKFFPVIHTTCVSDTSFRTRAPHLQYTCVCFCAIYRLVHSFNASASNIYE